MLVISKDDVALRPQLIGVNRLQRRVLNRSVGQVHPTYAPGHRVRRLDDTAPLRNRTSFSGHGLPQAALCPQDGACECACEAGTAPSDSTDVRKVEGWNRWCLLREACRTFIVKPDGITLLSLVNCVVCTRVPDSTRSTNFFPGCENFSKYVREFTS